jgi:hypothetical protein
MEREFVTETFAWPADIQNRLCTVGHKTAAAHETSADRFFPPPVTKMDYLTRCTWK